MRHAGFISVFFAASACSFGQHAICTVEGRHGAAPPAVTSDELTVELDRKPARVETWVLLRGDAAALELYIVIDDGTDTELGLQFESLKRFIREQPATTKVGLAYLRNGAANIVVSTAAGRKAVEKALRLPSGQPGIAASPYMGLSDLFKKWPAANARREVLLISSGTDPWSSPDPQNPYLEKAIADAQRGGIAVHSIYYPGAGHLGHSYSRINWGQSYLSELGDATGGEAYWQGSLSPVSFDPYLKDLAEQLRNQYLLTVERTGSKSGLQPLRVTSSSSSAAGFSIHAPARIEMR
jgi:hypothetical protein